MLKSRENPLCKAKIYSFSNYVLAVALRSPFPGKLADSLQGLCLSWVSEHSGIQPMGLISPLQSQRPKRLQGYWNLFDSCINTYIYTASDTADETEWAASYICSFWNIRWILWYFYIFLYGLFKKKGLGSGISSC